jgi:cytochrome bd ubiquinol oxidase subunit I
MSQLDLARLQFAMTSIYHLPVRPRRDRAELPHRHPAGRVAPLGPRRVPPADRFLCIVLVINVAVGVFTWLVQEFQFGIDWSGW